MYSNSFFNPYMYQPYYQTSNLASGLGNFSKVNNLANASTAGGISKSLFSKFNFSNFLTGASKTLNVVNQAIPIFYQVKPIINNAKTMFRIMGAVKDDGNSKKINNINHQTTHNAPTTNINTTKMNNTNENLSQIIDYNNYQEENPTFFI